jgi:hypothetical protein
MMKKFEYKNIRFDFKGRGITQEINLLDIDGKRVKGWANNGDKIPTLPELLNEVGQDGWELVSHTVNQDNQANAVTFHYLYFKREVSSVNEGTIQTI